MNKYTSLKLSKLLADNGFKGESNLVRLNGEEEIRHKRQDNLYNPVPVYDILNDLCVKYAKEMFGEDFKMMKNKTDWILYNLQKNMKDIAEDAHNLAKEMIRVYVERGDTIQDLKSGRMGCTLGDHDGLGSLGCLYGQKERNTNYIVIVFGNKQEFDFKLKDIFNDIKSNQLKLS